MAGLLLAFGKRAGWAADRAAELGPRLAHYPWLEMHAFEDDRFAARLVLHRDVQPLLWQRLASGVFVALHGEYYPEDRRIVDAGKTASGLAAAARAEEYAALRNGNGLYNLVVYDPERRRVTIANDATGALLLFRRETADGWLWSSEPEVLGDGPADAEGLAALIAIGYQPDHRTAVLGVEAMPPAATETYEDCGASIAVRRDAGVKRQENTRGGFAAQYSERLREAVRLRSRSDAEVNLPLSGGMDSRMLLGLAREAGMRVRTFVVDAGGVRDAVVAEAVARCAGVPFESQSPLAGTIEKHLPLLRSALFTTSDWHPVLYLPVCGSGCEGGEVWLGLFGGTFGGAQVHAQSATAGLAAFRANAVDPFFRRVIDEPAWAAAIPASTEGAVQDLLINLYGRQRRYTSYLVRLAWNFGRPVCPFADRRLLDLALGASREELAGQHLRRRICARMFPDLARVPSANDGLPLGSTFRRTFRNFLRRSGIGRMVRHRWPGAYRTYDYSKMSDVAQELWSLLPRARRELAPAGLSAMARLALGPVLLTSEDATVERALELVRERLSS